MSAQTEHFDVTFIGGGPVGLYGAFYAGGRGLRTGIIESRPQLGGRLIAHYPDKTIYDVAGHPRIKARDFIGHLVEQARRHDPLFRTGERVEGLDGDEQGGWLLRTDKGEHSSRTVVIAAGTGAFVPRGMEQPDAKSLEGKGVYYSIDNPENFRGKRVIIIGAGEDALDWALSLAGAAGKVVLVHRLNRFAAGEKTAAELAQAGVEVLQPFYELKELHGKERVEAVTFFNTGTGEEERREADAVVLNIGSLVNLSDFERWGLVVSGNAIAVSERMETNLPGVYAAGDIVTHPGKLKLISTGAGEAAVAVGSAVRELARRRLVEKRRAAGVERVMESRRVFYSGFEAVQMAIALVRSSVDFYQKAFFCAKDPSVKQLFAELQKEGHGLLKRLNEEVLPHYSGGDRLEDLDGTATAYLSDSVDPYLFGGHRLAQSAFHGLASDLEAVYIGIRVHEEIITFFGRLSGEAGFSGVKEEFQSLADVESRRLESLRLCQKEMMEGGLEG